MVYFIFATGFNRLVMSLMAVDMKRTDTLDENIAFLQKDVEDLERDVSLMAAMLGKTVEEREKQSSAGGK